jgi:hypothetical protein
MCIFGWEKRSSEEEEIEIVKENAKTKEANN